MRYTPHVARRLTARPLLLPTCPGGCYLFGLIFYLNDDIPFSNALWHTCVLAGAVSHWFIIHRMLALGDIRYPLPPA
jgi:hemolysin III